MRREKEQKCRSCESRDNPKLIMFSPFLDYLNLSKPYSKAIFSQLFPVPFYYVNSLSGLCEGYLFSMIGLQSNLSLQTPLYYGQFVWSKKCQKSYDPYLYSWFARDVGDVSIFGHPPCWRPFAGRLDENSW